MKKIYNSNAIRITLSYLIFGIFWIILSDKLVELFVSDSHSITTIQTYKGWAFIILTSLLLFFLLDKVFNIMQNEIEKHKTAMNLLKDSENKFRGLYDNLRDAFASVDMNGNIIEYNSEYTRMLGYNSEEIKNLTNKDITPDRWHKIEDEIIKHQVLIKGYSDIYEKEYRRKDGIIFPVELRTILITDSEKQPKGMWAIIRDITERKLAEEELQIKTEELDNYFTYALDLFCIADTDGYFRRLNKQWEITLGYSLSELEGSRFFDFVHPDDLKVTINRISELSAKKEVSSSVNRYRRKNGTYAWIEWRSSSDGKLIYAAARDITERKRAEDELHASKLFIEEIINSIPVRVFWKDKNLVYLGCNSTFARDAGFTDPNEIIGKDDFQMGWRDQADLYRDDDRNVIESGRPKLLIEEPQTTPDGKTITLLTSKIPLRNSKGEIIGLLGIYIDITERKLAEEKLQQSEELFRLTAENLTDVIFDWDIKENIDWYGDIDGITGYPPGGFPRTLEAWAVIVHPDDKDRVMAALEDHLKGVATYLIEYRVRRRDGEWCWWSARGTVLRNDRGEPYKMIGSITDITDRKQTEKALRDSEAKLKEAQRIGRLGSWDWDIATDTTTWSEEYYHIYGFDPKLSPPGYEEHLKMYTPESAALLDAAVKKSIQNGEGYQLDLEQDRTDGSGRWVTARCEVKRDDEGKIVGLRGTAQDITEHKQAEEKIKIFSAAVEDASDCFVLTDMTGDVTYANKSAIKTFGYSLAEILKLNVSQFSINPEEVARMNEGIRKKNIWNGEINSVKKNKEIFPVILSISLIKNDNDNPIGMMGVFRDITEQKHAATQLMEAKEKAEDMNRLKSNFLANMSHELRTPLVGILGFAEILSQDLEPQESKAMAETIYKSGKRLSETLNLILDLSKFETEKWEIKHRKIDLVSKTEEIINSFEGTAAKKGLTLKSSFSHHSIIINFDERAFHSILNNLINNALKFTSEGSVTTTISLNNDFVEIEVIDTGIGIAEQDYQNIFEEFRQASEGYNRNFEGSGLGLSITKKLVEKFDGTITVESKIGKGTTFKVILPVINPEETRGELTATETKIIPKLPEPKSVKPIALLVDDDPFVFTVLKRYASEYIDLETTVDADFAIKKLKKKKYDLIFMDINLRRGMDGKEATQIIRSMKGYESIPIIATTGYAMVGDKEEFLAAGCSHYLSKPFSQEEIVSLLEKVLKIV